jgi:hypothetical protein
MFKLKNIGGFAFIYKAFGVELSSNNFPISIISSLSAVLGPCISQNVSKQVHIGFFLPINL